MKRSLHTTGFTAALLFACVLSPAFAQTAKNVRFLVGSPAGGSNAELAAIAKMAAGVDTLEGFLREMKQRFPDGSTLRVSAEYFLQILHSPVSPAPLVIDQRGTSTANDDLAIGYAFNLADYNAYGPHSESTRGNPSFGATYERRLTSVLSLRAGANYYRARSWKANMPGIRSVAGSGLSRKAM